MEDILSCFMAGVAWGTTVSDLIDDYVLLEGSERVVTDSDLGMYNEPL